MNQESDEILTAAQYIESNKDGFALIVLKLARMAYLRESLWGVDLRQMDGDVRFQTFMGKESWTLSYRTY